MMIIDDKKTLTRERAEPLYCCPK